MGAALFTIASRPSPSSRGRPRRRPPPPQCGGYRADRPKQSPLQQPAANRPVKRPPEPSPLPHQCAEPDRALLRHAFRAYGRRAAAAPPNSAHRGNQIHGAHPIRRARGVVLRRATEEPHARTAPGYRRSHLPEEPGVPAGCVWRLHRYWHRAYGCFDQRPPAAGGARRASGRRRLVWLARKVQVGPPSPSLIAGLIVRTDSDQGKIKLSYDFC